MSELLTTQEAAERAGVGTTAIKRWADLGILPCVRTAGGHRRFRPQDIDALLTERGMELSDATSESAVSGTHAWVRVLVFDGNPYAIQAQLLTERARLGSWHKVAGFIGDVLTEIGVRWERGSLSIMQEHLASGRLERALARVIESIPLAEDAPVALLTCAEGEDHTLGLALAELCLREAGWLSRWSGRVTPLDEVIATVEEGLADMVAASASSSSRDRRALAHWANRVAEVCERNRTPLVLGGKGAWPSEPSYGVRVETFEDFREYLLGLGSARRTSR